MKLTMRLFVEHYGSRAKTCIFIDALDEFAGDTLVAISMLKDLAACSAIKILVSSRPEPDLVMTFEESPHIRQEYPAKADIETYMKGTVGSHPYVRSLLRLKPGPTNKLLSGLMEKAMGVFFWVVLAYKSLLRGFASYDRVEEMETRIEELPPELTDLF